MASIGDRLRQQRERAGLSLGQVGTYEGLTPQYLSGLERGRNNPPTWDLLTRLARRYGCTSDYLLGLAEHPNGHAPELPMPSYGREMLEIMADLSEGRRRELVTHAQVMLDAEQAEADVLQMRSMLDLVEAVGGGETLDEVLEILTLARTDPAAASTRMGTFIEGWAGRPVSSRRRPMRRHNGVEEQVEQG
jgi:transcriptional regulator with XRE-family HTH domain